MYTFKSYYCIFGPFSDWHSAVYCSPLDKTTVSTQELAEKLRTFYGEAKSKGDHKNTLKNIRSAINRHIQDLDRAIDVIRGVEFRSANRVLDGMLKQITNQG